MRIVGFDGCFDVVQIHQARSILDQGLRLHTAQHGCTTAFVAVGVRQLSHDVFVTSTAVRQNATQIALCARGHEQGRFFAGQCSHAFLQGVDSRVIAKHVVSQRGRHHGLAHGGGGLRDSVTAQINNIRHLNDSNS